MDLMTGSPCSLHKAGDLTRRVELDDVIDLSDVDPKLHRGGTDHAPRHSGTELVLGIDPDLAGEGPVMNVRVPAGKKGMADRLGDAPGVRENEGRGVGVDTFADHLRLVAE